ncbi:MAG: aldehyde reductase [Devosiaceae bacterium]|nr:aldehyde reductase [Devosiaceae bacterium]
MTQKVLLTGISGFLGGHIALQLLKSGYKVRGSVRNLKKSDKVRQTLKNHGADIDNLEFVALDLNSDEGWSNAMDGIEILMHTASPYVTSMPKDKMKLIGPAVEGTKRALNAALAAKVANIVLTSSSVAIMHGHEKSRTAPFTEDDWTNLNSPEVNAYIESKTLAEKKAWEIMEDAGRTNDLAVINPTLILGPLLDDDPGTSGALILRLLSGSIPAAPRFYLPIVDVRDVAAMHMAAMQTDDCGGKRFISSSEGMWIMQISNVIKSSFPQFTPKLPKFQMPDWGLRIYSLFDGDVRGSLSQLGISHALNNSRARKILGRDFIKTDQAINATVTSMIEQKLV